MICPPSGTDDACGVSLGDALPADKSLAWHVFAVKSNRERSVAAAIEWLAIQAYVPVYPVLSRWSDRTKTIEKPLFPGYVFARLRPADIPEVLALGGVFGVLDSNLKPRPVADSVLADLMQLNALRLAIVPCPYVVGDRVTVARGALRGVSGVVVRSKNSVRLVVAVEMLQRACSVELDAADLVNATA